MLVFAQNSIRQWFLKRIKPESNLIVLSGKTIYVLPTGYGLFYAVVSITMLIGAMNYSNSLGFLLTFFLAGIIIVAMLHTYRNLAALKIRPLRAQAVFAGEHATFELLIENRKPYPAYAIYYGKDRYADTRLNIPVHTSESIKISIPANYRGQLVLGPVRLWTHFPLGLFHVWSWIHPEMSTLIYPRPFGKSLSSHLGHGGNDGQLTREQGNEDYAGMRRYQVGDSPRHIAWKAVAKGHALHTKLYSGLAANEICFEWDRLTGLSAEQRLSQLCLWVLEAHQKNLCYSLKLPGQLIAGSQGEPHKLQCLTALALFKS